jgi:nitrogen fixation protein NifX
MSQPPISENIALRIALAARSLPDVSVPDLLGALQQILDGELNETTLSQITVTDLKIAFGGSEDLDGEEDGEGNTIPLEDLKAATQILWGELQETDSFNLPIEPYEEGEMPGSIRVAIASNTDELLDGHFGSCSRYLIYQLSATGLKLIDVRSAASADLAEDKNAFRVNLIADCHILFVISIGGPAAAKVIKANVYPMKKLEGGPAREILADLQKAIATSPPPWLAKVLGVEAGDRLKNYKAAEVG